MKVDISTIVMLLTEEDLLEKCAISNFEFCVTKLRKECNLLELSVG